MIGLLALGTGVTLFAVNCVCVYYMPRYSLPVLITAVFALLTCCAALVAIHPNRLEALDRLLQRLTPHRPGNHATPSKDR
ncbi:MAG: hypothetical protein JOZ21_07130 [Verrucomicrobia bacterium]|nr:hypothetical protein [Verrucomicrobiota bacterium]